MNQAFWQKRYDEGATGWDIGTVSAPLKTYIDQLTDKSLHILIPGCGYGHEAIYLSEQGFGHVTVIDLVDDALNLLRNNYPGVHCITDDFFDHEGTYDLILEQTLFCAIDPVRRDEYIRKVSSLLSADGKYVGVLFNREFTGGPPFGGSVAEYEKYFENHFSNWSVEDCYNSIAPRAGTELFIHCTNKQ